MLPTPGTEPAPIPAAPTLDPIVAGAMERFRQPEPVAAGEWFGVLLFVYLSYSGGGGVVGAVGALALLVVRDLVRLAVMHLLATPMRELLLLPVLRPKHEGPRVAWKEGVVIASGFFTMVVLSVVTLVVFFVTKSEVARQLMLSCLGISIFSLLPLYPYDGWRILNLTLFSRSGAVETAVALLTSLLAMALGAAIEAWLIVGFGVLNVVGIVYQRKVRTLAESLEREGVSALPWDDATLRKVAVATHLAFPSEPKAKPEFRVTQLLNQLRIVARRVSSRPPGALASVALLGMYGLALGYQVVAFFVAFAK